MVGKVQDSVGVAVMSVLDNIFPALLDYSIQTSQISLSEFLI